MSDGTEKQMRARTARELITELAKVGAEIQAIANEIDPGDDQYLFRDFEGLAAKLVEVAKKLAQGEHTNANLKPVEIHESEE